MKSQAKIFLSVLAIMASTKSNAFEFGQISVGGAGCPAASDVKVSTVGNQIVLDFKKMKLADAAKTLERTSCNLALPVKIPAGKQLLAAAETRGTYMLNAGDQAQANQAVFFAGQGDTASPLKVVGKSAAQFKLGNALQPKLAVSECGKESILRLNVNAALIRSAQQSTSAKSLLQISRSKLILYAQDCK